MAERKKKPLKDRPIYFSVRRMVDPKTGEEAGCLVPDSWASQRVMRERKFRTGDQVRATLALPRNAKFFRLVHQLGTLVRQNIPGFEHLNSHEVIKRLQKESGICCHLERIDAGPVVEAFIRASEVTLGPVATRMLKAVLPEIKTIDVLSPESIAYDCMDESEFRALWDGICAYLVAAYWPSMSVEQITNMAAAMPQSEGA